MKKLVRFLLFLPLAFICSMLAGLLFTGTVFVFYRDQVIEAAESMEMEEFSMLDAGEIVFGDQYGIALTAGVCILTVGLTAWWALGPRKG